MLYRKSFVKLNTKQTIVMAIASQIEKMEELNNVALDNLHGRYCQRRCFRNRCSQVH